MSPTDTSSRPALAPELRRDIDRIDEAMIACCWSAAKSSAG